MAMEKERLVALVTAAQKGDGSATNELFNAFYNDLYYFALKTVKDDDLALDITQEAFVEIINTLGNLKEPAAFVTWAKQITYHQCTRYFKKKKDVIVDEDEEGNTVFDTLKEENVEFIPDEALDKSDFQKTILGILDELSEEQRSAVMMYYFDEMSVGQIAEIQGVSTGTVKSRLNYARKAIKESVEDYEKKNGIKLHAIGFFPMFKWLFEGSFGGGIPAATAQTIAEGVTAATGTAVTAAAATTSAVATTAATTTAVGIGAKISSIPLAAKLIAAAVAATVVIGGTTTAIVLNNDDNNDKNVTHVNSQEQFEEDDNKNNVEQDAIENEEIIKPETEEFVLEGIIPEGCTYTLYNGTVLTAGQKFPETCTAGDKVAYGDYLYGYECVYAKNIEGTDTWHMWKDGFDSGDSGVVESDVFGSWSVMVADQSKETYGTIVYKINGKPIKTLYGTFFGCTNMTESPKIPSTITAIPSAYWGCSSLKKAPEIPANVQRIMMSFKDCTSLTGDVEIDATLDKSLEWYYSETFSGTTQNINLIGKTPESDLILIAQHSDNVNITVNGKVLNGSGGPEETPTDTPTQDDEPTIKEETIAAPNVEDVVPTYVSRLMFSALPHFSSADELTASNAFWFAFYGLNRNKYQTSILSDGTTVYEIPVSVISESTDMTFGTSYDFTSIQNEADPFIASFTATYTAVGGEDFMRVEAFGGGGDDYHPEVTEYIKLSNDEYQVNIAWYSGSSEKPTEENADYYYNEETGDYWIADRWEKMIVKLALFETTNGKKLNWRIVSYSER